VTELVKTPSPRLPGFLNYDTGWVETDSVMFFFFGGGGLRKTT
jgi:hypothetical protein